MKLESTISKLLANRTVLYVVSIIATLNIIGYLFYGNMTAVLYFIILALLVSYFSKNMIVILLAPLIFVNLFVGSQQQLQNIEGMENNKTGDDNNEKKEMPQHESTSSGEGHNETLMSSSASTGAEYVMEPSSSESFKNKKSNHKLDYAGTLKETYESLNQFLNKEGMEALTNDTKSLMEEQKKLAETMEGLKPMIKSIGPMMESMKGLMGGMGDMKGMFGGEGGMGNMENIQGMMNSLSSVLQKPEAK